MQCISVLFLTIFVFTKYICYYTILYYIILYYVILHYITLYFIIYHPPQLFFYCSTSLSPDNWSFFMTRERNFGVSVVYILCSCDMDIWNGWFLLYNLVLQKYIIYILYYTILYCLPFSTYIFITVSYFHIWGLNKLTAIVLSLFKLSIC